jgi:NADH dehydrogenase
MTATVVVLGAGYAGAGAIPLLETELANLDAELVWVSEHDYHLVLHEAHRVVRDPSVRDDVTIPVADVKSRSTQFVQGRVSGLDTGDRAVHLDDGRSVAYDYLLVAVGSDTAFYGISGLREHAITLKSLDDALAIHDAVRDAATDATRDDPAQVVVGGAGLSGIQTAGEIAEFRDHHDAPIEIMLVEALDEVLPNGDPELQAVLRRYLADADVAVRTDDPITEADADSIHFDDGPSLDYDAFVWTGGIAGRDCLDGTSLDNQHNRIETDATFETSDDRVFAVGDTALVEQDDEVAPPTAQAAWQAAEVAAGNLARAMRGESLETWTYHDLGTLISVGERAVAHDVDSLPIDTFGGLPAVLLKKAAAARWIARITSWPRALKAWPAL